MDQKKSNKELENEQTMQQPKAILSLFHMLLILLAMTHKCFDILDFGNAAYHFGKSSIMCAHKN